MAKFRDTLELVDKVSKPLLKMSRNFAHLDKSVGKSQRRLEKFEKQTANLRNLGNKVKLVGQGMTVGLTLPIVAAGGAMVKLASDMEETMNKVDVSFGASSDKVKDWAKNSITSMGLAQQSALDSAALYGDMATGMGLSQEKSSQMAMSLTQLSADLASFKNISNDVAQTALKSIFTGETESLKNLGVVMTETNLKQFAMSKGIRKNIKDMTEQEKIQLRYNYVMEKTKNAHGDFARTGGGASNQMRMFQENLKELGVTFGQYILPYFTKAVVKLNGMLVGFNKLSPGVKKTILIFGATLGAIGPIVTIVGTLTTAIAGLNVVLGFLAANPVVLAITAIGVAIWGVIKAVQLLIELFKNLKARINSIDGSKIGNLNLENKQNLDYLSGEYSRIGAKEFKKKYDRATVKAVEQNNKNITNNTNNTTNNTTNNNYYAGANPKMAKLTA